MTSRIKVALLLLFTAIVSGASEPEKFADRHPRYRLQPNDVVEIQYRYTPEFNATATVQPDGFLSLQLTGDVYVSGKTLEEVARQVEQASATRLKDPQVSILIKDFVKPHYIVAGEVTHPGTFDLRGDVTTLQAIATGGGFKDSAKHSQVMLIRRVNREWAEVKVLDMKLMMQKGKVTEDVLLQPDDIILVPQSNSAKMERYLRWASLGMYGIALARP